MSDDAPLSNFRAALGKFLGALDNVHTCWWSLDDSEDGGAVQQLFEARERLHSAYWNVKSWLKYAVIEGGLQAAIPPPGQTAQQWFVWVRDLVEEAWHLCRFVLSIAPESDTSTHEDSIMRHDEEAVRGKLKARLPEIHEILRQQYLHLEHARSIMMEPNGQSPLRNPLTDKPEGYTVQHLKDLTSLANTTLTRYAKVAGVPTPGKGQKDFRYPIPHVKRILHAIVDRSLNKQIREQCRQALGELP